MSNPDDPQYEPYPVRRERFDRGLLRASDADRGEVAQALSTAFAEGRLTREEHDARLDATMRARTISELEPLTQDLAVQAVRPARPPQRREDQAWRVDAVNANPNPDTIIAFFSGTDRKGAWRARRNISNVVMFGGTTLDLRDAIFESDVCEISIFCLFGGVDIIVPDGVRVENRAIAVFGGSDARRIARPDPEAPTVVVKGFVGFGGVDVKGKK